MDENYCEITISGFVFEGFFPPKKANWMNFVVVPPGWTVPFRMVRKVTWWLYNLRCDPISVVFVQKCRDLIACGSFQYKSWQHTEVAASLCKGPKGFNASHIESYLILLLDYMLYTLYHIPQTHIVWNTWYTSIHTFPWYSLKLFSTQFCDWHGIPGDDQLADGIAFWPRSKERPSALVLDE